MKIKFDNIMIIRTTILFIALLNQALVLSGFSPLPFDEAGIENAVTIVLTIVTSVWAWWGNNAVTRQARLAEKQAKQKGLK